MRLTSDQKMILEGCEGELLRYAMDALVRYGDALGAAEFIPVTSVHTFFMSTRSAASYFPPRHRMLNEEEVSAFCDELALRKVRARTTIDPGYLDIDKWRVMGGKEKTLGSVKKGMEICAACGILANWTCIPYLEDNIPLLGEHCSWSESSALIYCNSMLGARSNRDPAEASFFSALLGITPLWGMHLDENRYGTHLIDVRCSLNTSSDWGALGFYAGTMAGSKIPVLINCPKPTTESVKQMGAAINVPGGAAMFHIVGSTPEAPTVEAAMGGKNPEGVFVFDEEKKAEVYSRVNHLPGGPVDMVFMGCPHATLEEIRRVSGMLNGKRIADHTRFWIFTTHSVRVSAERMGYDRIIRDSGGELLADGCLLTYYVYSDSERPPLAHVVTDSVKQALGVRRSFGSRVHFTSMERCVEAAIQGRV